jgi:hypothetical protein
LSKVSVEQSDFLFIPGKIRPEPAIKAPHFAADKKLIAPFFLR